MKKPTILYRPVGAKELELIQASKWKKFPPRLPEQPIFYPVLTEQYACKIAKDWNCKQEGAGFVLSFKIGTEYINGYDIQTVGGHQCQEYWIPSDRLEEFNSHIVGKIKVLHRYQKWYVYILRCSDDTFYTGITNDLQKRIATHNKGKGAKYTRGRGPVVLVKSFDVFSKGEALKLEHHIKGLSKNDKLNFQG